MAKLWQERLPGVNSAAPDEAIFRTLWVFQVSSMRFQTPDGRSVEPQFPTMLGTLDKRDREKQASCVITVGSSYGDRIAPPLSAIREHVPHALFSGQIDSDATIQNRSHQAAFHLMEQPMDGTCSTGPFPVSATSRMASNRSRRRGSETG